MIADHDWSAVMPVAPVGLAGKDSTGEMIPRKIELRKPRQQIQGKEVL